VKYYCVEDIENLAAQGKKELILDGNTVLMDLARDMAHQLGITVVTGLRPTPTKAASPVVPSLREAAPKVDNRPKGCQHAPLVVNARQERSANPQKTDGVVDQLVEIVKQSTGKRSGN
jgi:hypothetical protein